MSNLRRRGSYGNSDSLGRGRGDRAPGRDAYGQSRYDRSRYGSGSQRAGDARSRRSAASYHETPYSRHSSSSHRSPAADPTGRRPKYRQPSHEASFTQWQGGAHHGTSHGTGRRSSQDAFGDEDPWTSDRTASGHGRTAQDYSREAVLAKRRRRPRKLAVVLSVVAVLVVLCGGVAFAYVSDVTGNLHAGVDDDLRNALVHTDMANEPFYMLLMGTDGSAEREQSGELDGVYRSDSMMLVRVDAPQKKATLVSIGRDTVVDLDEYGEQKINAAYGLGGPALAVKAVSKLADVPISHYAQVDFDGFSELVDALGGVEVDVPMELNDADAGGHVDAGLHTLDGREALILCRARNSFADISAHPDEMRAANQRLVMAAIAKKMLDSDIVTIAGSVQSISRFVSTDLEITDIIGLAQALQGLDPSSDIYTAQAPTNSRYEDDIWFEYIDKQAWKAMMERVEKGLPPTEESKVDQATGVVLATAGADAAVDAGAKYSSVTVKNGTSHQGLAAKTREKLVDAGFTEVVVGDIAEGYDYPETLVIYEDASQAQQAQQIASLVGQGRAMQNDGSYLLADTDFIVLIGDDWVLDSAGQS